MTIVHIPAPWPWASELGCPQGHFTKTQASWRWNADSDFPIPSQSLTGYIFKNEGAFLWQLDSAPAEVRELGQVL